MGKCCSQNLIQNFSSEFPTLDKSVSELVVNTPGYLKSVKKI